MTHPIQFFGPFDITLDEEITADSDNLVATWEDEGGATTNIFQSVNSNNDATWAELRSVNHMTSGGDPNTRTLRFNMEDPSDQPPSTDQTVEVRCRIRWVDVFGGANPDAGDPDVRVALREGATQRAITSRQTLITSFADHSLVLNATEIGSVTDWDDLNVQMQFEANGIDIDEEIDIEVSRVRIIFTP